MLAVFGIILTLQLQLIYGNETATVSNEEYFGNETSTVHNKKPEVTTSPPVHVYGTVQATHSQFPEIVSIRLLFPEEHICSGTILSEKWVLTAAHCVFNEIFNSQRPARDFVVAAGETTFKKLKEVKQRRFVTKIYIHSRYRKTRNGVTGDLALLKLITPFEFSDSVKPKALVNYNIVPNTVCKIAGWGVAKFRPSQLSRELMYTEVLFIEDSVCKSRLKLKLPPDTVCAGSNSSGAHHCPEDSGGGLICNELLTGVVSYGKRTGCSGPTIYTNVFFYNEWITEMAGASQPSLNIYCLLLFCIFVLK